MFINIYTGVLYILKLSFNVIDNDRSLARSINVRFSVFVVVSSNVSSRELAVSPVVSSLRVDVVLSTELRSEPGMSPEYK